MFTEHSQIAAASVSAVTFDLRQCDPGEMCTLRRYETQLVTLRTEQLNESFTHDSMC